MATTPFLDRLRKSWERSRSLLCIGLDPDLGKIPEILRRERQPLLAFNRAIIDATADLACSFKPQAAYYHGVGAEDQLAETIAYVRENHPHIPVILDAKRGDIGATAKLYALEAFQRYGADAVTVNPYMGGDTLAPFTEDPARGIFVLCRTSNPGSGELQELSVGGGEKRLFEVVAEYAVGRWNQNQNLGLVVGATYPEDLQRVRSIAPELPLLVPGVGAQGGDLAAVLQAGMDAKGMGLLINASRSVLYAGDGADFAKSARDAAMALRDAMRAEGACPNP